MTNYERGRRKEYDVTRRLRSGGWFAQRTAGSHGLWDITAVQSFERPRFIQVKYSMKGGTEWQDENWRELVGLLGVDNFLQIEAWVYRYGVREPQRWVATPEGVTLMEEAA